MYVIFKNFDIKQTLECGQIFRWEKITDTQYCIYVSNKKLNVDQFDINDAFENILEDFKLYYVENMQWYSLKDLHNILNNNFRDYKILKMNCTLKQFQIYWHNYFDLYTDYTQIKTELSKDEHMRKAIEHGEGIRILRQDKFETIIGFIISANNNINRIQKSMHLIAKNYGSEIKNNYGEKYYAFPTPKQLANVKIENLKSKCGVGYRDKYIVQTAKMIAENKIDLKKISNYEDEQLINELQKLKGVGVKVAQCIALFAYGRTSVYPIDVWSKRTFEQLYLGKEITKKEISEKVTEKFEKYAGYAQQYLFYYGREQNNSKN